MNDQPNLPPGPDRPSKTVRRFSLTTRLQCDPETVWSLLRTPDLLYHVAWPLVTFRAAETETPPTVWVENRTVRLRCYFLGCIPLGVRHLHFETVNADEKTIQTREHDRLIRRWDHLISVVSSGPASSSYTDALEIDARPLTLPVLAFAQVFYRHRQRKWRHLARLARVLVSG